MAKELREGVTTGTCATGAMMASVIWQQTGTCPEFVTVDTPSGRSVYLEVVKHDYPICSVTKDAGDDPDVTNGASITACVVIGDEDGDVIFKGGEGVGTITLPGLKLPVGEPAINPVPREMMISHIRKLIGEKSAIITISVPGGREIARKTFNPRLGIVDGISILGTSGIVRPMSEEAMKESLSVELKFQLEKTKHIAFVLGQNGEDTVHHLYGDKVVCVQISNYIGYMLDEALSMGAETILISGAAGKLVKVAADIMNTHSHVADGRRETICTYAALNGADQSMIKALFDCKTVKKTIEVVRDFELTGIWDQIAEAGCEKCRLRTCGDIQIAMVLTDTEEHVIGKSQDADRIIERVRG